MERDEGAITGVWTRGTHPQELVLSDGSRLLLESSVGGDGEVAWRRTNGRDVTEGSVSVPEALDLAGDVYSDYVAVRTRAEAAALLERPTEDLLTPDELAALQGQTSPEGVII